MRAHRADFAPFAVYKSRVRLAGRPEKKNGSGEFGASEAPGQPQQV